MAAYETDAYRVERCVIQFGNGSKAAGLTFVWNGDTSVLKEGMFDLKDWVMKKKEFSIWHG